MSDLRVEIGTDPNVEGFEILSIDGTDELYELVDRENHRKWFKLVPIEGSSE